MTAQALTITVKDGHIVDWMDSDLPTPHEVERTPVYSNPHWSKEYPNAYKITYLIEGYFGTAKGKTYLHDISSRIAYALNGTYEIQQIETNSPYIYKLERFTHLDRIPTFNQQLELNALNGSRHEIFEALRHRAYEMKRAGTLNLDALINYGNRITNRSEHIKYLAKNVYKWTESNYQPRPQPRMSRIEACRIATQTRVNRTKQAIRNVIRYKELFFDGISNTQLAKTFSVSRTSLWKYLQIEEMLQYASALLQRVQTPYGTEMNRYLEEIKESFSNTRREVKTVVAAGQNEIVIEFADTGG